MRITGGYGDSALNCAAYGANGQLQTLTDAEVNKTTYEYDGFDRLSKTRMPLPTKGSNASSTTDYEQLTYDAASNVTSRRLRAAASGAIIQGESHDQSAGAGEKIISAELFRRGPIWGPFRVDQKNSKSKSTV